MPMEYKVEQLEDRRAVFTVSGRLDAATAAEFKNGLKTAAAEFATFVVVDLSALTFIDSSGLSALVSGLKALREKDGGLALTGIGEQVRVAMELTRLDRIFPVYADRASALDSFTG